MSRQPDTSDADVVRLRAHDFEGFYRQEADGVYRALALTLGDVDLAQEAAAEALARAFQHWSRVGKYDNPAGWTYRVGLNWAVSRLRRRSRDRRRQSSEPFRGIAEPIDRDMEQALLELDMQKRTVIVLRYVLDMTQDQIAAALSIPVGTVKSRIGRGLDELRAALR